MADSGYLTHRNALYKGLDSSLILMLFHLKSKDVIRFLHTRTHIHPHTHTHTHKCVSWHCRVGLGTVPTTNGFSSNRKPFHRYCGSTSCFWPIKGLLRRGRNLNQKNTGNTVLTVRRVKRGVQGQPHEL